MSSAAPAQYLITLCNAAQQPDLEEPFGVVVRIGLSDSKFKAATTKVIHSILTFSPAADAVAVEFLNELSKVTGMAGLGTWSLCIPVGFSETKMGTVDPVSLRASPVDCATWAREVTYGLSLYQIHKEATLCGT
jgi:hypothetical protein